jgi:zinc and cadmium transporter
MNLSPFVWSLLLGLAAGGANVVGGLVVVSRRKWNKAVLSHFIALGAGFMLAATLLRMLPESFRLTPLAPLLILGGYFLVHFFEHTLAPHFHFGEEVHDEVMTVHAFVGFSALFGLSVHALFDGVSIASGFLISPELGMLIFAAVALHKIPEGFTVASIALASGRGKGKALAGAVILGSATVVGTLGMHYFAGAVRYALPFSTGVTLYVAASDLIPAVNQEGKKPLALSVFLGVALFYVADLALDALGLGH